MVGNIHRGSAIVDPRPHVGAGILQKMSGRERPGATRPSPRTIRNVLQWIDDAKAANRTWARNTLFAFGVFVALMLLAVRMGLLPH